jgi:hypothetical protein
LKLKRFRHFFDVRYSFFKTLTIGLASMLTLETLKLNFNRVRVTGLSVMLTIAVVLSGCSTVEEAPDKAILPEVPDYVKVPHPVGYELAEIRALFENPLAPQEGLTTFTDQCDQEFQMLAKSTSAKEDLRAGAQELVQLNAEKMHWCFYGKIERMQRDLKSEQTWATRQKVVLDTYSFLTPVSLAFISVYHDSRYLRWATQYYSSISEWIFFRKVVPGPENTLALTMSASSDLESWTVQQKTQKKLSVFTRYGISLASPEVLKQEMPVTPPEESRAPASVEEAPLEAPDHVLRSGEKPESETPKKKTEPKISQQLIDPLDSSPGFSAQIADPVPAPIGEPQIGHDPETVKPEGRKESQKAEIKKKKATPRKPATAPITAPSTSSAAEGFSL